MGLTSEPCARSICCRPTDEIFEVIHLLASLIAYELEAEDVEHQASEEAERLAAQGKHLAQLEDPSPITS
jgi:hypothetical protein